MEVMRTCMCGSSGNGNKQKKLERKKTFSVGQRHSTPSMYEQTQFLVSPELAVRFSDGATLFSFRAIVFFFLSFADIFIVALKFPMKRKESDRQLA